MAGNVFFPERFANGATHERDGRSEERHRLAAADRYQRAKVRLREIERAAGFGKRGQIFGRLSDRIAAAQAVGALVRQAKDRNVTVERIRSALPGTARRLDRYMLSPDIDPATAAKKSGKLLQRVNGYLEAATAVAELTGQDRDALKFEVLSRTSLWSNPSSAKSEDDPSASHLSAELIEMGAAVARRTGLARLFARARRIPGLWDIANESFNASSVHRDTPEFDVESTVACLHQDFYLDLFEHWTEAPPLPSVPLVRCVHAAFPTVVRVETIGRAERLADEAAHDDHFEGSERGAWFQLSREIRLALGPTTTADNVGLMFETRAHVALGFPEPSPQLYEISPNHSLTPIDDYWDVIPPATFQVLLDGRWHRVAMLESVTDTDAKLFGDGDHLIAWPPNPMDPENFPVEHWYLSWSAINSASVGHWLDRKSGDNNTTVVTPEGGPRAARPVWFASGSTAHQVERALASGGLEEALEEAVQHLRDALDQREAQWRAEAAAEHELRMIRWQQKT